MRFVRCRTDELARSSQPSRRLRLICVSRRRAGCAMVAGASGATMTSHKILFAIAAVAILSASLQCRAVPAFNRQTGQNCVACHAGGQFPDLTAYGRLFKLTGYTIGARAMPLALMAVAGEDRTERTRSPDPNLDLRADFPEDGLPIFQPARLFLAGRVTNNIGAFVQATYNNYDSQSPNDSHWS